MKKKISLLMAALMIVALFAACSSTPAASTAPSSAPSATPAPKVTSISVGISLTALTSNPWGTLAGAENQHIGNIYDALVAFDKDGKIQPWLADKYDVSADGKTYTFYIHKGVKFSDGTELKAADVKYSIEKAMTSLNKTKGNLVNVSGADIVDDYTVKMNMKAVDVSILDKMCTVYVGSKAAAEKYGDAYGTKPENTVGSGPYTVTLLNPKIEINYKANEGYFKGAPSLKTVRVKTIADTNSMLVALQTGDIQLMIGSVSGVSYDTIKNDPKIGIDFFPSTTEMYFFMNPKTGITADVRVRQAVAYAINRNDIFQVLTSGSGIIPDSPANWDYTGLPGKDKTWTYNQDITKAKQLIQDAGVAGKSVKILVPSIDILVKAATVLQSQLTAIGLTATIDQQDSNSMLANARSGNFEIGVIYAASATHDAGDVMYAHFYSKNNNGGGNYSMYSNPEMDSLLAKIQSTTDAAARSKLIGDAIALATKDVPEIPLAMANTNRPHAKTIKIEPYLAQFDKFYYWQAA